MISTLTALWAAAAFFTGASHALSAKQDDDRQDNQDDDGYTIGLFGERWRLRAAAFITEPKVHASEMRCYIRDPDGYLIEVGQPTSTAAPLDLYV